MGLQGSSGAVVTKDQEISPEEHFKLSDTVEKQAPVLAPGLEGEARRVQEILSIADSTGYKLLLKLIKDRANAYLKATHGLNWSVSDSDLIKNYVANSGAYQALDGLLQFLLPQNLENGLKQIYQSAGTKRP